MAFPSFFSLRLQQPVGWLRFHVRCKLLTGCSHISLFWHSWVRSTDGVSDLVHVAYFPVFLYIGSFWITLVVCKVLLYLNPNNNNNNTPDQQKLSYKNNYNLYIFNIFIKLWYIRFVNKVFNPLYEELQSLKIRVIILTVINSL